MTEPAIPAFLIVICFVSGLLLIAFGLPLWLRRIPRNRLYGVRFRSTLADEDVWYEINARCGRDLVAIGVVYVALLAATLTLGRSWSVGVRLLVPAVFLVGALIADSIALGVAAARLASERGIAEQG
jgi:uncharacterized membrane protein